MNYLNLLIPKEKKNLKPKMHLMQEAEADEMWSYIAEKEQQCWLWHVIYHRTGKNLAYAFGRRIGAVYHQLRKLLRPFGIKRLIKKIINFLVCSLSLSLSLAFATQQQSAAPLEKVNLQLKWLHQFQFAGYYAAKEKGYYTDAGMDVQIFERSLNKDAVEQVTSGEMDFAVGDSGILSYYARGEPIVALAAIFQHNPLIFIAKQNSGIISPYEMKGKRIMFDSKGVDDSALQAVLAEANLTEKDYTTIKPTFRNDDLIENKIDVMSGYLSDEIFYFQQKNIKINIINPQNYGIDFYGDILFTSQSELLKHPGRAEKFRVATLKGWQYALDHPEEVIQLIREKYHSRLSLAHLRFEAETTKKLMLADVIPLGQIEKWRMRKVAEVYAQLNFSKSLSEQKLEQFINPSSRSDDKPLIVGSEQDFPPFALGKTDDTADGFTVELWRAVAEEAHLNSRIRVLPWNQVLDEFKTEKIDILINFAIHDERRQFADFTVPHVTANEALFVRDNDNSIHSEADFNDKQFIIVKGDFAQEYLQEKGLDKQIVAVDTPEAGLQLLSDGQNDVMLLSKIVGKQILEKLNIHNIKMLPIDIGISQRFAFAVHKGDAELLAKINEALAITKANGTYDKLYEKWFGLYEEKELLPVVIKYLAPIVCVFLLILLVILYRRHVERKQAEVELRIAAIAFEAQEGMVVTDANQCIIRVNKAFTQITGYTAEDVIGKNPKLLQSGRHDSVFYATLWESIRNTGVWEGEIWNQRKNGETYPEYMTLTAVKDSNSHITNYVATFNDITLSRASADEIEQLAFYDPLTKLPNRRLLHDRLKQALATSHRNALSGGVLFIDMDNFKNLNDTLGHEMGDLLLVQVAERLLSCVRENDTVARLGGDEFVVLLENLENEISDAAVQIEVVGEKILSYLGQLYQLNTYQYISTPSIGAVLFRGYEQTSEELLKQADIAMYQAKTSGRNALRFFNPQMQAAIMAHATLKQELHQAVVENQFRLYYQAQVNQNRKITGAEVLIRWQHPVRGLISPDTFIPLAEEGDLILVIGHWVLETACLQLKIWEKNEDTNYLQLAVNVSPRQFRHPEFVSDVICLINETGINPMLLKLELTESMALDNLKETIEKMNMLRNIGVRFSMDDFGTGHSSLSSLKKLPIEQLKIDQSFVRDISTDSDDAVIVQTIIAMAKNLGLKIIAEGVETEEQRLFLELHGCENFQGYLFHKGVPIEQFDLYLKNMIC